MTKFIFVTGGVVSGIGKGIVAASTGNLLTRLGYSVNIMKCDPYINVDPGTMNPKEHGEVFVTYDGGETDLDLGHYERFLCKPLPATSCITTGSIYSEVLQAEREGVYAGKTVQIFHITNAIKTRIYNLAATTACDYLIVEIGGTVGDLESLPFIEAVRQIRADEEPTDTCSIHCSYVPYLSCSKEHKTKPTQHSTKELRSLGIEPDIIVTRPERSPLLSDILTKIATYCYVKEENVIDCPNESSVYYVPDTLYDNGLIDALRNKLEFKKTQLDYKWRGKVYRHKFLKEHEAKTINVAIIGKYSSLEDSYMSVKEALTHACLYKEVNLNVIYIDTTKRYDNNLLRGIDAVVVPGGFGETGLETTMNYLSYCRGCNIPTLGICLGMQLMCIEALRKNDKFLSTIPVPSISLNTREITKVPTPYNVIDYMENQNDQVNIGGTLRLGNYETKLVENTKLYESMQELSILERHRHRYEVNNNFRAPIIQSGLYISGTSPDNSLVETVEHIENNFYVGTQYHPEFNSNLLNPHPLFVSLISAALED